MRFHILGNGSLGNLIAHYLRKHNHKVTLILRTPTTLAYFEKRKRTITVIQDKEYNVEQTQGYDTEVLRGYNMNQNFHYGVCPSNLQIQRLIITTRAYDVNQSLQKIFYRLSPTSTIVLLSNGMGIYEELMENFFANDEKTRPNILMGTSTHVCHKIKNTGSQFDILHSDFGEIDLGIIPRRDDQSIEGNYSREMSPSSAEDNSSTLISGDFENVKTMSPFIIPDSLHTTIKTLTKIPELYVQHINVLSLQNKLLENLVLNACINPITAIFSMRNRGLLDNPGADRVLYALCNESAQIIRKHHEHLGMRPTNMFGPERLINAVRQICKKTALQSSDMLKDIQTCQLTEINYLNGYLVKLGKIYGIPTPINQFVIDMIYLKHILHSDSQNLKSRL
ncbi:9232_t:CDS:1 [Cetraspora pellucida]|uniref:2-dehydropantoate 2-reductase n=1 Tax=Cetraspora pellucida TaxID=1433469 RepID=A0A9N9B3C6_9GLOM|nr:9232_t:CDS:1 [Cetraspora pellucida]